MPSVGDELKFVGKPVKFSFDDEVTVTPGKKYKVEGTWEDEFSFRRDNGFIATILPEGRGNWLIRKPVEPVSDTDRLPDLNNFTLTCAHPHREVCEQLHDIYQAKNADYGNSFSEQYKEHGMVSSVIRLDDKMRRLKQLTKNDALVNESIEDTLLDLANYAIMTVMELRGGSDVDETGREADCTPKG